VTAQCLLADALEAELKPLVGGPISRSWWAARQLCAAAQKLPTIAFLGADASVSPWTAACGTRFQCDDWISRNLHVPYLIVSASGLIATRQRVMAIPILSGLHHHYVGYNFRKKQVSQKRQEPSALGPFIGKPDRIS
jgi:hypothetical protein